MKLLPLYKWIAGSQNDFTRQFQNNDQLFNQARSFWNKLDGSMWIVIICMLVLGIGIAAYYYTSYNNAPGRHYKPIKWILFLNSYFPFNIAFHIWHWVPCVWTQIKRFIHIRIYGCHRKCTICLYSLFHNFCDMV